MKRLHYALAAGLLAGWTLFVGFMFQRESALDEERILGIALSQARALFNQVVDVRDWNALHGGVYVPISAGTPPNPWLDVPNRDEITLTGRRLTLLNPAYMTRQLAEITQERRGITLHLTSLLPLRPENKPAPWEAEALKTFERGEVEQVEFALDADGHEVFRYMAPLPVEENCLPCHAKQGYRIGQIRGGISIAYPSEVLAASRQSFRRKVLLASAVIWLLGAGFFVVLVAAYRQKNLMVARLRELALVDDLTGLHNRRGFLMLAEKQLQIGRRTGLPDLLLFVDLDGLKRINDELGHETGDAALQAAAAVLQAAFRSSDIIARLGGDEFLVLCPNTGATDGPALLEGLQRHVGEANADTTAPWRLSLSAGLAAFDPQHPVTLDELIRAADAAMYASKQRKQASR